MTCAAGTSRTGTCWAEGRCGSSAQHLNPQTSCLSARFLPSWPQPGRDGGVWLTVTLLRPVLAGVCRGGSVPQLCPAPWGMSQAPAQPHSRLPASFPHCPTLLPPCRCRFIQGSATRNPYVFYHWRYIDVFVYFSHHTVTIPPVCWTNAAHRNGVPVLGEGRASRRAGGSRTGPVGAPGMQWVCWAHGGFSGVRSQRCSRTPSRHIHHGVDRRGEAVRGVPGRRGGGVPRRERAAGPHRPALPLRRLADQPGEHAEREPRCPARLLPAPLPLLLPCAAPRPPRANASLLSPARRQR